MAQSPEIARTCVALRSALPMHGGLQSDDPLTRLGGPPGGGVATPRRTAAFVPSIFPSWVTDLALIAQGSGCIHPVPAIRGCRQLNRQHIFTSRHACATPPISIAGTSDTDGTPGNASRCDSGWGRRAHPGPPGPVRWELCICARRDSTPAAGSSSGRRPEWLTWRREGERRARSAGTCYPTRSRARRRSGRI
ncbi:hypothetical protein FA95DRAFT_1208845 [Auriscalpium vulgare]|uniref:Uncharacterized protein n=1 Tax=Auriscalpium vulgare TaxID=40419 RepID=A0ACB8RTX2_9AGAM|nr:hypothetical protein FA95DRAFT_1208845 [Auriscalpium vulgare]